jgi:hypothetical protein
MKRRKLHVAENINTAHILKEASFPSMRKTSVETIIVVPQTIIAS